MTSRPPLPSLSFLERNRLNHRYLQSGALSQDQVQDALEIIQGKDINFLLDGSETLMGVARSPLSMALLFGHWELALGFLERGADPFLDPVAAIRLDKSSPLTRVFSGALDFPASRKSPAVLKILSALIDRGALINGCPDHPARMPPIHFSAGCGDEAFSSWAAPLALSLGADVNLLNCQGETALMTAAWHNKPESCLLLLEAGANDALIDEEGESALSRSLAQNNFDAALALLKTPSAECLAIRPAHGRGPLSFACATDHQLARMSPQRQEAIDRLTALGADLMEPDRLGQTPLGHLKSQPHESFQRSAEQAELGWICSAANPLPARARML